MRGRTPGPGRQGPQPRTRRKGEDERVGHRQGSGSGRGRADVVWPSGKNSLLLTSQDEFFGRPRFLNIKSFRGAVKFFAPTVPAFPPRPGLISPPIYPPAVLSAIRLPNLLIIRIQTHRQTRGRERAARAPRTPVVDNRGILCYKKTPRRDGRVFAGRKKVFVAPDPRRTALIIHY